MRVSSKKKSDIDLGKKPTIQNVNLLDRSYSMHGEKYDNAILGINEEQEALKKDNNANYLQTIIEFDSDPHGWRASGTRKAEYIEPIVAQPIGTCKPIKGAGARGNTPLYEAVGYTIRKLLTLKKPEDRVLLKIFTDGGENESNGEFSPMSGGEKKLYDLIKGVQENHKFTVTFIGTQIDTDDIIRNLGIAKNNTLVHDNTGAGVKMSSYLRTGATMSYAKEVAETGVDTVTNFYSKSVEEEKK